MAIEIKVNPIERKLRTEELTKEELNKCRHPKNTGDKDDEYNTD